MRHQNLVVVQPDQEVLALADHGRDLAALEPAREVLDVLVPADRPQPADLDRLDFAADEFAVQIPADGFDFGELRHRRLLP